MLTCLHVINICFSFKILLNLDMYVVDTNVFINFLDNFKILKACLVRKIVISKK